MITQALAEIPALVEEAQQTWGTRAVSDDSPYRRTAPGSRTLADLDRLLVLDGTNTFDGLGVLSGWVRIIAEELGEHAEPYEWPADSVASVCAWLTDWQGWCAGREFEEELHRDVHVLHGRLRAVCGFRNAKSWTCLTAGCRGSMHLMGGYLECTEGHRHDGLPKWRHHPSIPIPEAADMFGIPERTVRAWASCGTIPTDNPRQEMRRGHIVRYVWPWDIVRRRFPDLAELVEFYERDSA